MVGLHSTVHRVVDGHAGSAAVAHVVGANVPVVRTRCARRQVAGIDPLVTRIGAFWTPSARVAGPVARAVTAGVGLCAEQTVVAAAAVRVVGRAVVLRLVAGFRAVAITIGSWAGVAATCANAT